MNNLRRIEGPSTPQHPILACQSGRLRSLQHFAPSTPRAAAYVTDPAYENFLEPLPASPEAAHPARATTV